MKACSKCGASKSVEEFRAYVSRGKLFRRGACKKCESAYSTEYFRVHPKDPVKEQERLRRFRRENPEKDRSYGRKWREKDSERSLALARKRLKKYRNAYPERHVAYQARRRARVTTMTSEDVEYMAILRSDPCSYCGTTGGVVDHIEPLYRGGRVGWENLTAACQRCNSSKSTRSLVAFLHIAASRSL